MRRLHVDPGLVAALLVGLFAAWPLLTRPGLPTATDADIHSLRTQQILAAWQGNVWFTRWAPDMAYGFGYPVFNYYAPLGYYLAAAYGWFGGGPVAGVKFVLVLSNVLSALGMYGFARGQWHHPAAAGASAAAFALAPYLVYINPVARGAMPETLAVALSPWLFWIFNRLRQAPSALNFSLASLLLAVLLLSHNLMSFVFTALLLAWLLWEAGCHRSFHCLPLAAVLAAVGLAAFFYLPAFLERGAVQFERGFAAVKDPASPLQFVSLTTLLAPATPADLADPTVAGWQFRLGLPQWLLASLSGLALFQNTSARRTILFFGLSALGLTGLMLPVSLGLWKSGLPLIYLQLPWRLLGPLALALAVLAGAAIDAASRLRLPTATSPLHYFSFSLQPLALACVPTAALILAALPLLKPLPWADYGPADFRRLLLYEQAGNVGTTAQNEFLPSTVQAMPPPQDSLLTSSAAGEPDKIDYAILPPEAQATVLAHGPLHDQFALSTPTGFTLQVFTFSFPGWTAYLDGGKIPLTPSVPAGFITVPIPAGEHTLLLRLEDTWPRQLGWAVSVAALLATAGLAIILARRSVPQPDAAPAPSQSLPLRPGGVLILAAIMASGCGALYLGQLISARETLDLFSPAPALLEGHLALAGYGFSPNRLKPGETLALTLSWQATGPAARDASVFVHLLGPTGELESQSDKIRPVTDWPTDRWPLGRIFLDNHALTLRADAPAGKYTIQVGLWDRYTGLRFSILDADDQPVGGTFSLPPLSVEP